MRVLLDECLPERLKDELPGHQVFTAREAYFINHRWCGGDKVEVKLALEAFLDDL